MVRLSDSPGPVRATVLSRSGNIYFVKPEHGRPTQVTRSSIKPI